MPGGIMAPIGGRVPGVAVVDDTLFILQRDADDASGRPTSYWTPETDTVLFSRSFAEDDDTVTLGTTTRIARASGFSLAEHDGTIAYLRRVDGRLVLRAPDGTETLPSWGAHPDIVWGGPAALTKRWFAPRASSLLFDRTTGATYDLTESIPDVDKAQWWTVQVTDDQAFFGVVYSGKSGIYVVALGDHGPTGPTRTIQEVERGVPEIAGIVDGRLVWSHETVRYDDVRSGDTTVYSVPLSTPTATPTIREFPGLYYSDLYDAGSAVVLASGSALRRLDPVTLAEEHVEEVGQALLYPEWLRGTLALYDGYVSDEGWRSEPNGFLDFGGRKIVADSTVPAGPPSFRDVPAGNQFAASVSWLAELGISTGYADGGFHPTESVTRQAMAAFLYRLAGEPAYTPPATSPFADVATSHPFYTQITWLASTGISTGTKVGSATYFKPGDAVSRQAMAAFLFRFAGEPDEPQVPATSPFADVPTSHPFYDSIAWLAEAGVSTGTKVGNQTFYKPNDAVSRQAMAAFMHRLHAFGLTVSWHAI